MTSINLTPQDNQYQKTSAGKKWGTILGAGIGAAYSGHTIGKFLKENSADVFQKLGQPLSKTKLNNFIRSKQIVLAVALTTGALLAGAAGRLIGAIRDKIVNKNQASQTVEKTLQEAPKSEKLKATLEKCDNQLAEIDKVIADLGDGKPELTERLIQKKIKLEEFRFKVLNEYLDSMND